MASSEHLSAVISSYGELTKSKLSNPAATGAPEDQLRAPLEGLFQELAILAGNPAGAMALVGETTLAALSTRPDYAVTNRNELIGFIEIKAPGKGADPRKFAEDHDKRQWRKLKCLPNLLYTDGNAFSVWNNGELSGKIVKLDGDVETSGKSLRASQELVRLVASFLSWNPVPPRTAKNLAEVAARLCRLLRDEVVEELRRDNPSLEALAKEWRDLLFPQANDAQFADGYAQAVTFGLLMAKARDISLANGIGHAALELREANSLIGTALRLLTDDPSTRKALETSLDTLVRVLDVIDWNALSKGQADASRCLAVLLRGLPRGLRQQAEETDWLLRGRDASDEVEEFARTLGPDTPPRGACSRGCRRIRLPGFAVSSRAWIVPSSSSSTRYKVLHAKGSPPDSIDLVEGERPCSPAIERRRRCDWRHRRFDAARRQAALLPAPGRRHLPTVSALASTDERQIRRLFVQPFRRRQGRSEPAAQAPATYFDDDETSASKPFKCDSSSAQRDRHRHSQPSIAPPKNRNS